MRSLMTLPGDLFRRGAGPAGLRALVALVAVTTLAPSGLARETVGGGDFRGSDRAVSGMGVPRTGRPAAGARNTAERAARDLRSRGPDEVRTLRRRHAEEVFDLTGVPGATDPLPAAGALVVPPAVFTEEATGPAPIPAGGLRDVTGICRVDARSVCIARDFPVAAVGLWCARRHLEFDPGALGNQRVATCPESVIEAVWVRESPDRPPLEIHPPGCAAAAACRLKESAGKGKRPEH